MFVVQQSSGNCQAFPFDVVDTHILLFFWNNNNSYELTDLQYAPEIAAGMLVRQQAQALVEARFTIVEGAVNVRIS